MQPKREIRMKEEVRPKKQKKSSRDFEFTIEETNYELAEIKKTFRKGSAASKALE